jgi:hypothetical protein
VAQPVQLVKPVATDATASTVCPASPEIAVRPPHRRPNWFPDSRNNARAKLHQATLAHQDQKDPTDHPAMLVHLAPMARTETKDPADHPDHPAHRELQETKDPPVIPAESLAPNPAPLAHPARLANPARQALQASPVMLVKTVAPAPQVLPVMPAHPAVQAKPAVPALLVIPAKPVPQVRAITAHRLVWLQVIKQLNLGQFDWAPSIILFLTFPLAFGNFFFSNVPCGKIIQI